MMFVKPNTLRIIFVIAFLGMSILACRYPGFQSNSVERAPSDLATLEPGQPILGITPSGAATIIVLNETQINSVIQQALASQPELPVQNVRISLQEGSGTISGNVQQNGLDLPLTVTLSASVDGQGGVNFNVESASIGFLPLPQSMLDQISAQINQSLRSEIIRATNNIFVEAISISDGLLTVTGRTR
jgi:hypothetical protein